MLPYIKAKIKPRPTCLTLKWRDPIIIQFKITINLNVLITIDSVKSKKWKRMLIRTKLLGKMWLIWLKLLNKGNYPKIQLVNLNFWGISKSFRQNKSNLRTFLWLISRIRMDKMVADICKSSSNLELMQKVRHNCVKYAVQVF